MVWNHRWEFDKGPESFFAALSTLADRNLDFEVAVLGQSFQRRPEVFDTARDRLGKHIVCWGFRESREEYLRELTLADVAVSTALHEFQGLSILEAAACGAAPLVPRSLAYPEIWPEELLYDPGTLADRLEERIFFREAWRSRCFVSVSERFGWENLLPRWREVFYASPQGNCP